MATKRLILVSLLGAGCANVFGLDPPILDKDGGATVDGPIASNDAPVRPDGPTADAPAGGVPDTTITSGPATLTNQSMVTFDFMSTITPATFTCSVDGHNPSDCPSPDSMTLPDGDHTLSVAATANGQTDPTPATASWTIDTMPPDTSLDSTPPSTSSADVTFLIGSTEQNSSFECSLDGKAFAACDASTSYTGLGDGPHSFQARAIDAAGNVDPTPTPVFSWTVSSTIFDVQITMGPSGVTSSSVSFSFVSSQPTGTTFKCGMDLADPADFTSYTVDCTSPKTYSSLPGGQHTFSVIAYNPPLGYTKPAIDTWTVDATGPDTTINTPADGSVTGPNVTLSLTASKPGSSFSCKLDVATGFSSCSSGQTLSGLGAGSHMLSVYATDSIGNTGKTATSTWTVDTLGPTVMLQGGPGIADGVYTTQTSATFSFTSSKPGSTFQCSQDGKAYMTCTSGQSVGPLGDGPHSFSVEATDSTGNTGAPSTISWTVDTMIPTVQFLGAPSGLVNINNGSSMLAVTDANPVTMTCQIDGKTTYITTCTSSVVAWDKVPDGPHTLTVVATDAAGNSSLPSAANWSIDATPPQFTTVSGMPSGVIPAPATGSATYTITDASSITVACTLNMNLIPCSTSSASFSNLPEGNYTLAVTASDLAGNMTTNSWPFTVDTTKTITSFSSPQANTVSGANRPVIIDVNFSGSITADTSGGMPTLSLNITGAQAQFNYCMGTVCQFVYNVTPGAQVSALDVTAINLNGANLYDQLGQPASLAFSSFTTQLLSSSNVGIDGVSPSLNDITSTKPNSIYGIGASIDVKLVFSEPVTLTAGTTVTLALNSALPIAYANYSSGSGTSELVFTYTVNAGDSANPLDVTQIQVNGQITDLAGNPWVVQMPSPGQPHSLSANKDLIIDGTPIRITSITSNLTAGTVLTVGSTVLIFVNTSQPVTVTPTSGITLETGATDEVASYNGGSGTTQLAFQYTVKTNDENARLDVVSTLLTGTDNQGNNLSLTIPMGICDPTSLAAQFLDVEGGSYVVSPRCAKAPNWNDYVKAAATSTACDGSETSRPGCLEGGELRRVTVPGQSSCANLSAVDSLGVFNWTCSVSGTNAYFDSSIKPGQGLRNLVNAASWKDEQVTIFNAGNAIGTTGKGRFWSNPVAAAPIAASVLAGTCGGDIYTIANANTNSNYELAADKLALVTLPGASLVFNGTEQTPCGDAQIGGPCAINVGAGGLKYVWVEVNASGVAGSSTSYAVAFINMTSSRINSTSFSNVDSGVYWAWSTDANISGLSGSTNATSGFGFEDNGVTTMEASNFRLHDSGVFLINGTKAALSDFVVESGSISILQDQTVGTNLRIGNGGSLGVNANNIALTDVVLTDGGILGVNGSNDTIVGITTGLGSTFGLLGFTYAPNTVLWNALAEYGSTLVQSTPSQSFNGTMGQLALGDGSNGALYFSGPQDWKFTGNILLGGNVNTCQFSNGSNGLTSTCALPGPGEESDATIRQPASGFMSSISGKVTTDDPANTSDSNGSFGYSAFNDWTTFSNPFRNWGKDGSGTFPNSAYEDACTATNPACRIYDWSLRASASVIRNTSGDGTTQNGLFVAGGACPSAVSGSAYVTSHSYIYDTTFLGGLNGYTSSGGTCSVGGTCYQRFLKSAYEILDDGIGDDDGLCEAGEACIYAPNFGAYQGEGALASCTFNPGVGGLAGITMYGYTTNGK